jgi:hypothetical protein
VRCCSFFTFTCADGAIRLDVQLPDLRVGELDARSPAGNVHGQSAEQAGMPDP